MAIISTTGPSGISVTQMLWQCIDWTDPENPVFKTSGGGGGGGGGDVAVTSIAPGDNNIGNVDIASFPANTFAGLTPVTMDFDTGAGVASLPFFGLARSANGGPVELGTASTPIRTDPTGTTIQPVSAPVIATAVDIAPVTVNTSAGSAGSIITANSARTTLTLYNYGANDCWVNHSGSTPQANRGWIIKAGKERTFTGGLAARDWNGIAIGSSTTLALGGGVG